MRGEPAFGGFRLERHGEIDSTNTLLRAYAEGGEPEGLIVLAVAQARGRGRHGRSWNSPPGNLYASLLLRPQSSLAAAATLALVAGLSVAEALQEHVQPRQRVTLKWPNDLLLDGAKLAGILLEGADDGAGGCAWVVIGLGLNLARAPAGTPYPATSLAEGAGLALTPDEVLATWLPIFGRRLRQWRSRGFAGLRDAWLAQAQGLGSQARLRLGERLVHGRFAGLDADGALLLEGASGGTTRYAAGELFFA